MAGKIIMLRVAHFKCLNRLGIKGLGNNKYSSEAWDISDEDARQLVGGKVYFHTTKTEKSYFGGKVDSFEVLATDNAHERRIKLYLTAELDCKGVEWQGKDHMMSWYSGIIEKIEE